jgi:hypothetical protein
MNGVDEIWITVLSEWIGNELSLLNERLLSSSESAFWITESHESSEVVHLEVNGQEQLRLQVSW